MRNTTQILYIMAHYDREMTRQDIRNNSNLTLKQVSNTLNFLMSGYLVKVRYIKTDKKPYRKALYSLNREKYESIIRLIRREIDAF